MFSINNFKKNKFIIELENLEDKLLVNFLFDCHSINDLFFVSWNNDSLEYLDINSFNEFPKVIFSDFFKQPEVYQAYLNKLNKANWKNDFLHGGIAIEIQNVDKIEDLIFSLNLSINGELFNYLSEEDKIICVNNNIEWYFGDLMKVIKY